ncbi:hypothetical protein FOCC_FOCC001772 [Frankliniella occidentalis]|nr:hypothetical protein FOCC_FOCC001772 [Frankliniella occidentalis]
MYGTTKTSANDSRPKPRASILTVSPAFRSVSLALKSVPSISANQMAASELSPVDTVLARGERACVPDHRLHATLEQSKVLASNPSAFVSVCTTKYDKRRTYNGGIEDDDKLVEEGDHDVVDDGDGKERGHTEEPELRPEQVHLGGLAHEGDGGEEAGSKHTCAPAPPSFTVVPCSCCDEERVMEFMQRTFYREEPVLVAAGLAECPPQVRVRPLRGLPPAVPGSARDCDSFTGSDQVLLDHTRASFREGLSLMAVLQGSAGGQGDICGVAVNSIVAPGDACKLRQQAEQADCPATRRVLELWSLMLERPEIWSGQDPEGCCMLELRELATDQAVRGLGVGLQLALAAREVAADVGAPAYKIDCTSQYSGKIAEKLGMKKVFSLKYADFLDSDGKPLFQPPCPHVEAAVYVQSMSKDCQHKFGGEL